MDPNSSLVLQAFLTLFIWVPFAVGGFLVDVLAPGFRERDQGLDRRAREAAQPRPLDGSRWSEPVPLPAR